jgi:DNA-binding beta-propeller fold protein YncE
MKSFGSTGRLAAIALCVALPFACNPASAQTPLLQLESKIPLGNVAGRIDHLAVDLKRRRVFVAELGNNTLGVVDLAAGKLLRRLTGLSEPQGVGYDAATDIVYVANAGNGAVDLFRGEDYAALEKIQLGEDADNIRVDAAGRRVIVGYGKGALAVIDPATHRKIADVPLKAHPEGFQLDPESGRVFVNLPDAQAIAVVDMVAKTPAASWPQVARNDNFPMALDLSRRQVLSVFRNPALLTIASMTDGAPVTKVETCADSDDVFVDAKRSRAYVTCGEGFADVIDIGATPPKRIGHVATASGARTSLFVPDLDRLIIAVPARGATPAAVWVYRPDP